MKCDEISPFIEDYHDGELDDLASARVLAHLRGCVQCSRSMASLDQERDLYRAFSESVERDLAVTPKMWAAVEEQTKQPQSKVVPGSSSFGQLRTWFIAARATLYRFPATMRQLVYAAMLVAVSVTATQVAVNSLRDRHEPVAEKSSMPPAARPTPGTQAANKALAAVPQSGKEASEPAGSQSGSEGVKKIHVVRSASGPEAELDPSQYKLYRAMQQIQRAQQEYLDAIRILTTAVNQRKASLDPMLIADFERNLRVIDESIAATRRAYLANPKDADVAQFLLAAYAKKVHFLQDVAY